MNTTPLPVDTESTQLAQVAWWYYLDGMTQEQIAKRLSVSRASVGRQLDRARTQGIVNISISPHYFSRVNGASEIREHYKLHEVLVVPGDDDANTNRLAVGAAQVLQSHLRNNTTLAIGWGRTVSAAMAELPPDYMNSVSVVSLTGGVNAYVDVVGNIRGGRRDARDGFIPTPIVVSEPALATALRAEKGVQAILDHAAAADMALIGIGALRGDVTLTSRGYATADELQHYADLGAVGDLLGMFYDHNGKVLDLPLHQRRIGVPIDTLRAIPTVVAVAGGIDKIDAVKGALNGGYIDILVVDEAIAHHLL